MSTREWLVAFREARPDVRPGAPVYAFRCTDGEFDALGDVLRDEVARRELSDFGRWSAACLCLYGAEWWSRRYTGGAWRWQGMLSELGVTCTPTQLYAVLERGLVELRRWPPYKLGNRWRWIATLAGEGGLPLGLLQREGSHLRRYLRALLVEWSHFRGTGAEGAEIAASLGAMLPRSLQQVEIYEVAAALVEGVVKLRKILGTTLPPDPVAVLNRDHPAWARELPLRVDNAQARELLRGLIRALGEPRSRGHAASVSTVLAGEPGQWHVERRLAISAIATKEALLEVLGSVQAPPRLALYVGGVHGPWRLIAQATIRSDSRYRVETAPQIDSLLRETPLSDDLWLRGTGLAFEATAPLWGGGGLGPGPWVFVDKPSQEQPVFVGEGSVRTVRGRAWVVADASAVVAADGEASLADRGLEGGRRCTEIQGAVSVEDDTGRYRVVTSSRDDARRYRINGRRSPLVAEEVFVGIPSLTWTSDEGDGVVPDGELRWRPRGDRGPWHSMGPLAVGAVQVAHVVDGEVRGVRHAALLPAGTSASLVGQPGAKVGVLRLDGLAHFTVGVDVGSDSLVVSRDGDAWVCRPSHVAVADAPDDLTVLAKSPRGGGGTLRLSLPFPQARVTFSPALRLHSQRLAQGRVEVLAPFGKGPFWLEARLITAGDPERGAHFEWPLAEVDKVRHALDLASIAAETNLLLAMTPDLDARVELRVRPAPRGLGKGVVARVGHFLGSVERSSDRVVLPGGDGREPRVVAVRVADPETQRELIGDGQGQFVFEPAGWEPGTWLLMGYDGDFSTHRPARYEVSGGEFDGLDAILEEPNRRSRLARLRRHTEAARGDVHDPIWQRLAGWIATRGLPPQSFDGLEVAVGDLAAPSMLLLRAADEHAARRVWDKLQRLPFCWETLSPRALLDAARVHHASNVSMLRTFGLGEDSATSTLRDRLTLLGRWHPSYAVLSHWIGSQLLGDPDEPMVHLCRSEPKQVSAMWLAMERPTPPAETSPILRETMERLGQDDVFLTLSEKLGASHLPVEERPHLLAPVAAAAVAMGDQPGQPRDLLAFRLVKLLDPAWFERSHGFAMAMALASVERRGLDG